MALLSKWDPFTDLLRFQRDMNRMFANPFSSTREEGRAVWQPTCDVLTRGEDLVIRAELPGVKPDDLDISITDDVLSIRGVRREKSETSEQDFYLRESSFGSFERRMALPKGINADEIRADYEDGVVEITVPKAAAISESHKRSIPVTGREKKEIKPAA